MVSVPLWFTRFRHTLIHPTNGIAGLVNDLLAVSRDHSLKLDWQAKRCQVRFFGGDREEQIDVPIRRSVFRAILARMATLCKERPPNAVSPYGGQGELSVASNPGGLIRV